MPSIYESHGYALLMSTYSQPAVGFGSIVKMNAVRETMLTRLVHFGSTHAEAHALAAWFVRQRDTVLPGIMEGRVWTTANREAYECIYNGASFLLDDLQTWW
jgi:hypothetical protein